MNASELPYFIEKLDEIIDPKVFTAKQRQELLVQSWSAFLNEKRRSKLPPPTDAEVRAWFEDLVIQQRDLTKEEEEFERRYFGALVNLHRAYTRIDAEMNKASV